MARKPIRVLLIAPSERITGGQSVQAQRLLALLGTNPRVRISFLPLDPQIPSFMAAIRRIRYARTILSAVIYWPKLVKAIVRADLVHVFSASYWSYALWSFPAVLVGVVLQRKVILNYRSG